MGPVMQMDLEKFHNFGQCISLCLVFLPLYGPVHLRSNANGNVYMSQLNTDNN